jgi:peptide deformylase
VPFPHPALRFESVPVQRIDDRLRTQVRAMFDLMYESRGVGLAANQVALPFRFFILNTTADPDQREQEQVFINPEIVKRHSSVIEEEGCLSFPGVYGKVQRAKRIRVRAFDLAGNLIEIDAEDLLSRAVQHETDHLSGRLFIDLFAPDVIRSTAAKVEEVRAGYLQAQAEGQFPSDDEIQSQLRDLSEGRAVVA